MPLGNVAGKNDRNLGSFLNSGQRFFTLNSSYYGTLMNLTSGFFITCLLPIKISLMKSLLITSSAGR